MSGGEKMVRPVGQFVKRTVLVLCIVGIVAGICLPVSADETNAGNEAAVHQPAILIQRPAIHQETVQQPATLKITPVQKAPDLNISAPAVHTCSVSVFGHCLWGTDYVPVQAVTVQPAVTPAESSTGTHPVMHLTNTSVEELQREAMLSPRNISLPAMRPMVSPPDYLNLLTDSPWDSSDMSQRDQGLCGNCYVWATTGALEIAHTINNGVSNQLSIQYYNDMSGSGPSGTDSACGGGWPSDVVNFYNSNHNIIPWSNTNAYFGDGRFVSDSVSSSSNGNDNCPTDPALNTMDPFPSYSLNSVQLTSLNTGNDANQALAIQNIRNSLLTNHPVILSFQMNDGDMNYFQQFWSLTGYYADDAQYGNNTIWDPSFADGDWPSDGHSVLIVGYDERDPNEPCWIVLNSWGTTPQRPDGTYLLSENMNYDAKNAWLSGDDQQNTFQIIDAGFAPATPLVSSVSPSAGPSEGDNTVTISGFGFTGATDVYFGRTEAESFTVNGDETITATTPPGSAGSTVDITVKTPAGTTQTSKNDQYAYIKFPTITGVSPNAGPINGGNTITISGTDFDNAFLGDHAMNVEGYFGTTSVSGNQFTVTSDTTMTVKAPPGSWGSTVDITLACYDKKSGSYIGTTATSPADMYSYETAADITSAQPTGGLTSGGDTVSITGDGLNQVTQVYFGTTPASSFKINGPTEIDAISPPHAEGIVDITVATPSGTTAPDSSYYHVYVASPTITGVSPDYGPLGGGNTVTVTGNGFKGPGIISLSFGPVTSDTPYTNDVTVVDDSTITAPIPPSKKAGTVDVQLFTDLGTSATSPADRFTYELPPEVTGVSPDTGPGGGGNTVTISGSYFNGTPVEVDFGGLPATGVTVGPTCKYSVKEFLAGGADICFLYNNNYVITATPPPGNAGTVDVTVTTPAGTSKVVPADEYIYNQAPAVTSVSPTSGPDGGGNTVTITGFGFDTSTTVAFGGTPATNVTFAPRCFANICLDAMTATPPAESVVSRYFQGSFVDVTATTAGRGTSATSPSDIYAYDSAPVPEVTGVSPSVGEAGTVVTISGSGLAGAADVSFGDVAATNITEERVCGVTTPMECVGGGDIELTATAPAVPFNEATAFLGKKVDVTVTTPRGTSAISGEDEFTYPAAGVIRAHGVTSYNTGSIAVTSYPPGAAIFLDGKWTRNVTPFTFDSIEPGNHVVKVRLTGFGPASRTVTVNAFSTATANFNYIHIPLNATTVTATNMPGYVFAATTTPAPGITINTHEHVVYTGNMYTPVVTTAPVTAGVTSVENVNIRHTNLLDTGSLAVTSSPAGAEIWINGGDSGQVTPYTFTEGAGSYQVVVKMDCYTTPDTQTVTVTPDETATADFSPAYEVSCNAVSMAPVTVIRHVTV
jgi:C1A family cysteine protease